MPSPTAIAGLAVDPKALGNLRSAAAKDPQAALKSAAREFETLFLDMMMKSMRSNAQAHSVFDNEATRVYTGLLDHEFSRKLASQGGLGLADVLLKQLTKLNSPTPGEDTPAVKKSPVLPIKST